MRSLNAGCCVRSDFMMAAAADLPLPPSRARKGAGANWVRKSRPWVIEAPRWLATTRTTSVASKEIRYARSRPRQFSSQASVQVAVGAPGIQPVRPAFERSRHPGEVTRVDTLGSEPRTPVGHGRGDLGIWHGLSPLCWLCNRLQRR